MKVSQNPCLYEQMAHFLLMFDASFDVVTVAGKIISVDADLLRYGGVLSRHIGLGDPDDCFEVYDALRRRCVLVLSNYSNLKDDAALLGELSDIERELSLLSKRD